MLTLDGQERKLEPNMLVITDGVQPIALAGVMGGANSEVTDSTVNILLESARFDSAAVRKTSRQVGFALNRASGLRRVLIRPALYLRLIALLPCLQAMQMDMCSAELLRRSRRYKRLLL